MYMFKMYIKASRISSIFVRGSHFQMYVVCEMSTSFCCSWKKANSNKYFTDWLSQVQKFPMINISILIQLSASGTGVPVHS